MPVCRHCDHLGREHEWKIARMRGKCRVRKCPCQRYAPLTDKPQPLNSRAAKITPRKSSR
jgi:hypothetical protein